MTYKVRSKCDYPMIHLCTPVISFKYEQIFEEKMPLFDHCTMASFGFFTSSNSDKQGNVTYSFLLPFISNSFWIVRGSLYEFQIKKNTLDYRFNEWTNHLKIRLLNSMFRLCRYIQHYSVISLVDMFHFHLCQYKETSPTKKEYVWTNKNITHKRQHRQDTMKRIQ